LELKKPINNIVRFDSRKFLDLYLKTYYATTKERTKLITNIPATLEKLSGKVKLAMVTMRHVPRQIILEELDYFGISQYFLQVMTALDTLEPKPAPDALIKTSQAIDVPIRDCVIVGDSVCDIRAGKAAGAKTVAVLSGLFSFEELVRENPNLILKDAAAIQNYVGK
jgi:HAD superfamily hydrolase (TIGR01509 family)